MQIDKLVLEATYLGDASMAPKEYMTITSTTQVRVLLLLHKQHLAVEQIASSG